MNTIQEIENEQVVKLMADKSLPEFAPGDTLKVNVKVVEGSRERIQAFEGMCIARKNDGLHSSFTVRKLSYGEGLNGSFRSIRRMLIPLRWSAGEMCDVLSFITFATGRANVRGLPSGRMVTPPSLARLSARRLLI